MKVTRRKPRGRRSGCPIGFTLDIVGDRWTLLVLRDMIFERKRTFGEFLNSAEHIATNILTDRLKRLEHSGLVCKELAMPARRAVYALTEKGLAMVPVLLDMVVWGATYDPGTEAPPEFVQRVKSDRDSVVIETLAALGAPSGR
jgi:DNA-binding HxlR family transcriptional regulator